MSELKATPGPWHVGDARRAGDGSGAWLVVETASGVIVVTVNPHLDTSLPDAHLIAAAPDLFAALKAILDVGDGHGDFEEEWPAARAALAKALNQPLTAR